LDLGELDLEELDSEESTGLESEELESEESDSRELDSRELESEESESGELDSEELALRLSKDVSMSCRSLLCISVPIRRSTLYLDSATRLCTSTLYPTLYSVWAVSETYRALFLY